MDAVVAVEPELNSVVREYLEFLGYSKTTATFCEELHLLGKQSDIKASPLRNDNQVSELQVALLAAFDNGSHKQFFDVWNSQIPAEVLKSDSNSQKLEFNINIYFAVFPITNGRQNKHELGNSMKMFKAYLENKGAGLSQTTEFLPYYALPFVPDPTTHPSFKPLFSNSWSLELRSKLESFLQSVLKSQAKPKLFTLFKSGPDTVEKERKRHADQLRLLQHQLSEVERRSAQYYKKFSRIQGDYQNLIGVAAELVDSLENAVRGKMVTPEYLHDICMRLFSNTTQDSIDVTKPGTASSMLRASIAQNIQSLDDSIDASTVTALDYEKVKADMVSLPERERAFLLQALRWRLTKAKNGDVCKANVRAYIIHDLLGLTVPGNIRNGVLQILNHPSDLVRQYAARVLNALASFSSGRSYFSQNTDLVLLLHASLLSEQGISLTSENVLGTLQKLSLRRRLQTVMIENDLIQWLVSLLDDHDSLTDYTLEYSVALLMNLCLRSAGKKRCMQDAAVILKVLSDLLGHENQEIRPYVNGALYSILALPAIKEEARAMGMESILECFLADENPDMKRQIQFIIKQLNTENPMATNEPVSDDEDEEDDDDEGDAIDVELDKHEKLLPDEGELYGEELLATEYAVGRSPTKSKPKNKLISGLDPNQPLTRPTTPGMRPPEPTEGSRPGTTTITRPTSSQSRPHTSSGSRPGSRPPIQDEKPSSGLGTQTDNKLSSTVPIRKLDPFSSKPKLPRTPEPPSRPGTSTPPLLARSMSPTRSLKSRQGSAASRTGSRKGSQTSQS